MLVAETLTGLQRELKTIVGNSLVLLGGSYFHGGAVEKSDIDFFVIVSWWNYFKIWQRRKVIKKWKGKNTAETKINVMIVPRFFYRHGWYCVSGRGLGGKKYYSKLCPDLVLNNAFKLSAFYGLKFLNGRGIDWARKAGKQLAIVSSVKKDRKEILAAVEPVEWNKERLLKYAEDKVWDFSWVNYFIYNLKFLPKFDFTFLFCNPDKKVWSRLKENLERKRVGDEEMVWLEKYVFPVIII